MAATDVRAQLLKLWMLFPDADSVTDVDRDITKDETNNLSDLVEHTLDFRLTSTSWCGLAARELRNVLNTTTTRIEMHTHRWLIHAALFEAFLRAVKMSLNWSTILSNGHLVLSPRVYVGLVAELGLGTLCVQRIIDRRLENYLQTKEIIFNILNEMVFISTNVGMCRLITSTGKLLLCFHSLFCGLCGVLPFHLLDNEIYLQLCEKWKSVSLLITNSTMRMQMLLSVAKLKDFYTSGHPSDVSSIRLVTLPSTTPSCKLDSGEHLSLAYNPLAPRNKPALKILQMQDLFLVKTLLPLDPVLFTGLVSSVDTIANMLSPSQNYDTRTMKFRSAVEKVNPVGVSTDDRLHVYAINTIVEMAARCVVLDWAEMTRWKLVSDDNISMNPTTWHPLHTLFILFNCILISEGFYIIYLLYKEWGLKLWCIYIYIYIYIHIYIAFL